MPFFSFFCARTNEKRPTTKDFLNDQKSGLIIRSDDHFLHTHIRTRTKHKAEEEEDKEDEEEEDEERETTALLFIRISFCLIFLNRYHRLSKVVVVYDSVKARTFFSSVAPKRSRTALVPFSTQNSTTTRTTTITTTNGDEEEEDEEESEA